jgi:hypothetical protein
MNMLLESLTENSNLTTAFQLMLDLSLLVLVVYLLKRRPKPVVPSMDVAESIDKIIAETKEIAESFDANLQERQQLIQQLMRKLDHQLEEGRKICQKLEKLQQSVPHLPSASLGNQPATDNYDIVMLARKGLDVSAIARRLQKPVGEVELVLKLQQITPDR